MLLHQHWLKETWGICFTNISDLRHFFFSCLGRCRRPCFSRAAEGPFQAGLPSNSGHYLQTQRRKDRAAAVAKVIAVVRGKAEMGECLLDLQWKVNEQRSWAKLFSSWLASSSGPLLFFLFLSFCGESIETDRRWRGDLFEKGRTAMETSHASTLPLQVFILSEFKLFLGHQRINCQKNVLRNSFYEISFTLIADLGLLRNSWYRDCLTNWDQSCSCSQQDSVRPWMCKKKTNNNIFAVISNFSCSCSLFLLFFFFFSPASCQRTHVRALIPLIHLSLLFWGLEETLEQLDVLSQLLFLWVRRFWIPALSHSHPADCLDRRWPFLWHSCMTDGDDD